MECGDGSVLSPLSISFPEGDGKFFRERFLSEHSFCFCASEIVPCSGDDGQEEHTSLLCRITFKSPKPVSFTKPVIFKDELGNSFSLLVSASADNCLLTCYPFLAQHRTDHQIVCAQVGTKSLHFSFFMHAYPIITFRVKFLRDQKQLLERVLGQEKPSSCHVNLLMDLEADQAPQQPAQTLRFHPPAMKITPTVLQVKLGGGRQKCWQA